MKRVGLYLKFATIFGAVAVLLLVVLNNLGSRADFWFFGTYDKVPVLWLVLVTSVTSIIGWWIVGRIYRLTRELEEVSNRRRVERQIKEQQRLARDNAERERRIDEKLRRSITEEP